MDGWSRLNIQYLLGGTICSSGKESEGDPWCSQPDHTARGSLVELKVFLIFSIPASLENIFKEFTQQGPLENQTPKA